MSVECDEGLRMQAFSWSTTSKPITTNCALAHGPSQSLCSVCARPKSVAQSKACTTGRPPDCQSWTPDSKVKGWTLYQQSVVRVAAPALGVRALG